MLLHTLAVGPIQANCYLLKLDGRPDGVVIDPGAEPSRIAAECAVMGLAPAAILLTHGHFDHVGGVEALLHSFPATPVYFHRGDRTDNPRAELAWKPVPGVRYYEDGDVLTLAGLTFEVLHTPGHSPGSVTLRCDKLLFTGDTLFRGSMGRTDFSGGDGEAMMASLRRLAQLPGDYRVYPGHDRSTTLEEERQSNPYLRMALSR